MSASEEIRITAHELMEFHVEALFTQDLDKRLRTINEPWSGETPAPQFFLGRTVEGTTVCRFRYDVPDQLVEHMKLLCADEPLVTDFRTEPKHIASYMRLLQGERFTMGPCYFIPRVTEPTMHVVSVTRENMLNYLHGGFEWLTSEIDYAQPCIALVIGNRAVSICRSVRITSRAHEAGLETLEAFRGRGYAAAVVAGWAKAVREVGAIPLNSASQSVARKSALNLYGVNFTIL